MRLESKLESARRRQYYSQLAAKYIHSWVPNDCFQTLALVVALVFVGVALKCLFEFLQESLVGSVVNLSQFDMRNRFFSRTIHLDVSNFGEAGTHEIMARFTNDMETLAGGQKTEAGAGAGFWPVMASRPRRWRAGR